MPHSQHIHEDEMRECLRQAFDQDPESDLLWQLAQRIRDPGSASNEKNRRRLHPLLIIFAALFAVVLGTFLYFSCFQP